MATTRRQLRRGALVFSCILVVFACAAWVRSAWVIDTMVYNAALQVNADGQFVAGRPHWRTISVELQRGALLFERGTYAYESTPTFGFTWRSHSRLVELFLCSPARPDVSVAMAGFTFQRWTRFPSWRNAAVRVPLWSMTSAGAVMPVWAAVTTLRRRRRRSEGHCANCGYDLRATPERCPECGRPAGDAATPTK